MRIVIAVHQFFPERYTGTEVYTLALAREMRRRGHAIAILTHSQSPPPESLVGGIYRYRYDDFPVYAITTTPNAEASALGFASDAREAGRQFAAIIAECAPDLVHFTHLMRLGMGALRALQRARIPYLVTLTDFFALCPRIILVDRADALCAGPTFNDCVWCMTGDPVPAPHGIAPPAEAYSWYRATLAGAGLEAAETQRRAGRWHPSFARYLRDAAALLAPTRFLRDVFVRNGYPEERLTYSPFGIEQEWLAGYRPLPPAAGEVRIGFLGSVVGHKGVDVLVAAFRGLPDAPIRLDIHGEAPDAAYTAALLRRIGDDPRIAMHGAFTPAAQPDLLARLDAVVVPSIWYENTPLVLCATVLAGIPVVVSDMGGLTELVTHEQNGLVFPVGDVAALRATLHRLVANPALRARLAGHPRTLPTPRQEGEILEACYAEACGAD